MAVRTSPILDGSCLLAPKFETVFGPAYAITRAGGWGGGGFSYNILGSEWCARGTNSSILPKRDILFLASMPVLSFQFLAVKRGASIWIEQ